MIHKAEYVKELIRKQQDGPLTPLEAALLRLARKIHGEEEWQRLVADASGEREGGLPDDPLRGWEPDFAEIVQTAHRRRRVNAVVSAIARYGMVAAAMLTVFIGYHVYHRFLAPMDPGGICADLPRNTVIPASEFALVIRYGDTASVPVEAGARGRMAQVGNLEIHRDGGGTLVVRAVRQATAADTVGNPSVRFITVPHQQCEVLLPDGTRIRLNAGSVLEYPLLAPEPGTIHAHISGEAFVRVPQKGEQRRMVVETPNGRLQTPHGDFAVVATSWDTRATLLAGDLSGMGKQGKGQMTLDKRGNQIHIKTIRELNGEVRDAFYFRRGGRAEAAIAWTKATRDYRNAPLREFVEDISRWYGFRVQDIHCIPESMRVRAAICYRAPLEDALAVVNKAGLKVYQSNGVYSFCESDNVLKPSVAAVDQGAKVYVPRYQ